MCTRVRLEVIPGQIHRSGGAPISELVGITGVLCMTVRSAIKAPATEELPETVAGRMLTQQARELIFAKPVHGDENCGSRTVKNS